MAPKLKPPPKPPIPVPVSIHSVFTNPDDIQYLSDEDALSPAHFGGGEAAVPSKHRPRSRAEPTEDAFGPPPNKDDALGPHLPEDASGPPQTDYADDDAAANDVAYVQQLIVAEDAAYVLELLERESAAELAALTPAVQPQVPSAPHAIAPAPAQDAMSEILFLMRQQQADMDALKQELARKGSGQSKTRSSMQRKLTCAPSQPRTSQTVAASCPSGHLSLRHLSKAQPPNPTSYLPLLPSPKSVAAAKPMSSLPPKQPDQIPAPRKLQPKEPTCATHLQPSVCPSPRKSALQRHLFLMT